MSLLAVQPTSPASAQAATNAQLERRINALERTAGFIAPGAVFGSGVAGVVPHLAAGSVSTAELKAGSITAESAIIANAAIDSAQIKDAAVTNAKIANLAVDNAKIANLAVDSAKIADLAVQNAKIADLAVSTAKIADLAVDNAKIANLHGDKITASTINADRLVATSASADTLLARLTHTGSLVASTGLSAVSANLGLVTAGTITGAVMRSAASGARWQGDTTGLTLWDASNTVTFKADTATGKVSTLAGLGGFNLVKNSSFEDPVDNTLGWLYFSGTWPNTPEAALSGVAGAGIGSGPIHGTRVAQILASTALTQVAGVFLTDRAHVKPGEQYTLSTYAVTDNPTNSTMHWYVVWYNAAGNSIGSNSDVFPNQATGTWGRHSVTVTALANAVTAGLYLLAAPGGLQAGKSLWLDAVQFEQGSLMTAYSPKADENLTNSISATELAPGSVSGNKAGVAEAHIVPGTIIATDLFVTSLSAITADMGTLTAGRISGGSIDGNVIDAGTITASKINATAIDGMTITGATLRTAATGQRVEITTAGLTKWDGSGNFALKIGPTDGLELLAGTTTSPPNDRRINWKNALGSLVAELYSYETASVHSASFYARGPDSVDAHIVADRTGVPDLAALSLYSSASGLQNIRATAGIYTKDIITSDGASSFLQLNGGLVQRAVAFGAQSVTGNGTPTQTAIVNHGLGRTAQYAIAIMGSSQLVCGWTSTTGSTSVTFQVRQVDNLNWVSNQTLYWLVIG